MVRRIHDRYHFAVERTRVFFEIVAALFVSIETHFFLFSLSLWAWAILDVIKLLVLFYWEERKEYEDYDSETKA